MRDRRDIPNHIDPQAGRLERANGRFPTCTGALHVNVDLAHSTLHCLLRRDFPRSSSRKRRALPRPFKALVSRAGPHNRVAPHIRDGHDGVIERGLNVRDTALNNFLFSLLSFFHTQASLIQPLMSSEPCPGL